MEMLILLSLKSIFIITAFQCGEKLSEKYRQNIVFYFLKNFNC